MPPRRSRRSGRRGSAGWPRPGDRLVVLSERRRQELHRPFGAGGGGCIVASLVALDLSDGGEHAPGETWAARRGLFVEGEHRGRDLARGSGRRGAVPAAEEGGDPGAGPGGKHGDEKDE